MYGLAEFEELILQQLESTLKVYIKILVHPLKFLFDLYITSSEMERHTIKTAADIVFV